MVVVAIAVPIVASPVIPVREALNVSPGSTRLSSLIATVKVWNAPLAEPAGKLTVPVVMAV
ncbi:hypothetical protein D3C85_1838320 [compost metagenome]